jgi:hypothetical protein
MLSPALLREYRTLPAVSVRHRAAIICGVGYYKGLLGLFAKWMEPGKKFGDGECPPSEHRHGAHD